MNCRQTNLKNRTPIHSNENFDNYLLNKSSTPSTNYSLNSGDVTISHLGNSS